MIYATTNEDASEKEERANNTNHESAEKSNLFLYIASTD